VSDARPIDATLAIAKAAGSEDVFRLLLGPFEAGRYLYSKVGIPPSPAAERFRKTMAEVEIGLLGLDQEEVVRYWEIAMEPFE